MHFPSIASPTIACIPISFSETIKTLGVTLDENLTLNKHVSSLSHSIHFYTCALRHIRPTLSEFMATTLGASIWYNPDWTMLTPLCMECHHLTRTNYSLPRILSLVWFCLLFAIFQQVHDLSCLHWLSVHYRIQFKFATLTYKTLATCQPSYLYNLLQVHQPPRAVCMYACMHACIWVVVKRSDRQTVSLLCYSCGLRAVCS